MSRTCCPPPSVPPYPYAANCAVTFTRYCSDGSGTVSVTIPAAYLSVKFGTGLPYTSQAAAQVAANAFAERLARRRALQTVLYCNTVTPSDVADCGLVEERPVFTPGCAFVLCTNTGDTLCTDDSFQLKVSP
jgi:hypothetical protein